MIAKISKSHLDQDLHQQFIFEDILAFTRLTFIHFLYFYIFLILYAGEIS